MTNFTANDVGRYFMDKDGFVWVVNSYCDQPTVELKRLQDRCKISGAVGCLNIRDRGFVRLVPEDEK